MTLEQVVKKFEKHPKYMTYGAGKMSKQWKCSRKDIYDARKIVRGKIFRKSIKTKSSEIDSTKVKNVLVISDTHLPYEKDGYLDFCKEQYDKYNCDTVIHIGDLIDLHTTSRHPAIPDAFSPGDELTHVIRKLKKWYKVFPEMNVCIGNHDIRVFKQAIDSRIASKWIKGFNEVLEVPNWKFDESFEFNDIIYTHGIGTSGQTAAYKRAINLGKNIVIGHLHTEASIIYHKFPEKTIFGMIVGCGVDQNSYGMNYAKNFPKQSIISCGIILEDQPIIKIMK